MRDRANPNTRTERPSRPLTVVHVTPSSLLANAPDPLVPATTRPALNWSNATVTSGAPPVCTEVHVVPPSVLLNTEPFELPAMRTWLLSGSTARARTAVFPCWGSGGRATHVEAGSVPARTARTAVTHPSSATSVAARRRRGSDTSVPIITQPGPRTGQGGRA